MAFVYALDPTTPAGGEAASLGDDRIREFKNAVVERFQQLVRDYTTDPYEIELDNRTYTSDVILINGAATWNNAGVTFTAFKLNITNTASAAASKLIDLQVATVSQFSVTRAGVGAFAGAVSMTALTATTGVFSSTVSMTALTATATAHTFGSDAGAGVEVRLNGAAGNARFIHWRTAGVSRWTLSVNNTAETGSDAGSNVAFTAYTDAGVAIDSPLIIARVAGGQITLGRPVSMSSTLAVTGNAAFSTITASSNIDGSARITAGAANVFQWNGRSRLSSSADGIITLENQAGTNFTRLNFGGTSSSFPAIQRSGQTLHFKLADDSGYCSVLAAVYASGASNIATLGTLRLANAETISWRNAANSANHTVTLGADDRLAISTTISVTGEITSTADVAFGAGSRASSGVIRLANNTSIAWRNAANSANITLTVNASDVAVFSGAVTAGNTLTVTTGGLTVSAGGITVTGNSTITGTLGGITTLTATTLVGTLSTAAQPNITSLGTLTALQVDNLNINGNTISSTSGALNITPLAGQAIVLDGTINVDAGVVTGATSITSTGFTGALTGNASTATTLQTTRTIWGQNFNGSANVTGALSGVTTIVASSTITGTAFISTGTPSTTGTVRLENNTDIGWRNAANSGNVTFRVDSSNRFDFGANAIATSNGLQQGTGNVAATGWIRAQNLGPIRWRNNGDTADIGFFVNASDVFQFEAGFTIAGDITLSANASATASGRRITIGRNTGGVTAAGTIEMIRADGSARFLWVDGTGDLRIGSSPPDAAGGVGDLSGTVVGTQT